KGFTKTALANVIPRAQDKRVVGGRGVVLFWLGQRRSIDMRIRWIDHHMVLLERGGLCDYLPVCIEGERRTIEDQTVVAAHLVAHEHRHTIAPGNGRQHLAANRTLRVPE